MRATSTATLPLPITTARPEERSNGRSWKSGWALYQATNAVAGQEPGRSSPGNAHPTVGLRADRVDDRVVEARELLVRDVAADLDVAEEPEPGPLRDLLERARDRLDLRMVGRDTEPDEPPRGRQPVEEVDLDRRIVGEKLPRGVESRRGPSRQRRRVVAARRSQSQDNGERMLRAVEVTDAGEGRASAVGRRCEARRRGRARRGSLPPRASPRVALLGLVREPAARTYNVMDFAIPDEGGAPAEAATFTKGLEQLGRRSPRASRRRRTRVRADRANTTVRLASGRSRPRLSFNGTVPGPELRVREGELVEVTFGTRTSTTASRFTGTASTWQMPRTASPE